ncbi:MAG: trypsin-like peptidase domain-containing protein [Dehalococcoidia bacterium]|nr:trypsin-like peptidase domain-containing protein [Dehalococcoidia bacterium]
MDIQWRRFTRAYKAIAILAILATVGLACAPAASLQPPSTSAVTTSLNASPPVSNSASSAPAAVSPNDFTAAVRQVALTDKPAVVQITNEQVQAGQFNQPFSVPAGVGSGFIFDNQGHILTNNHVVDGAQQLLVSLPDGRSFQATLVGTDPLTDLAVIQISAPNLPIAPLGDSTKLQVGDWVVAIGNALALEGGPTVTAGVVSALNRAVQEPGNGPGTAPGPFLFDLIQTDAPINPGNSGGPLVNLDGQVVGIDTLVAGQAEPGIQAQGIGFAIALSTAMPIANQLIAAGKVAHPYLGINYTPLNPAIAAHLGITQTTGALVSSVVRGSPAAAAGIQGQDVITAIDGTAVKTDSDLAQIIDGRKPNDAVTLTVLRNGQQISVKVALGERSS